jgi:hypothetical protein
MACIAAWLQLVKAGKPQADAAAAAKPSKSTQADITQTHKDLIMQISRSHLIDRHIWRQGALSRQATELCSTLRRCGC